MAKLSELEKSGIRDDEIVIPLPNGGTLRCGPGSEYTWGGYLRICDPDGNEILFWDRSEWEASGEGESVIGAVFGAAIAALPELLANRVLEDGIWRYRRPKLGEVGECS